MCDLGGTFHKFRVHAVLLSIQLCFSGWLVVGSVALQTADPLVFAMYREISASLLMLGLVFYKGAETLPTVHAEDYPRFLFLGFCSFINVVGTLFALQLMPATRYSVMQPTIPVLATMVSVLIGAENLTVYKFWGIAMAVSGAMTIGLWKGDGEKSSQHDDEFDEAGMTLGMIIVTVQCFAFGCLLVFQQPLVKRYDTAFVTFVYYSVGTVVTLIMSAGWAQRFTAADFYFNGLVLPVLALMYAVVFATLYAYNAYAWAGKRVDPSVTSIYSTVQPVSTAVLSLICFGDIPTSAEFVGGALVVLGLVLTIRGKFLEQQLQRGLESSPLRRSGSGSSSPSDRYTKLEEEADESPTDRDTGPSEVVAISAVHQSNSSASNSTAPGGTAGDEEKGGGGGAADATSRHALVAPHDGYAAVETTVHNVIR